MSYENNALLSKARDKRGNGPDYYGQIKIDAELAEYIQTGQPVRVAVWRKENERGVYLSMQLSLPRESQQQAGEARGRGQQRSQARGGYGRQQAQDNGPRYTGERSNMKS